MFARLLPVGQEGGTRLKPTCERTRIVTPSKGKVLSACWPDGFTFSLFILSLSSPFGRVGRESSNY